MIAAGDLVNIDVSAEKDGYFGDTGASFAVPPVTRAVERLMRDGKRAMWEGVRQVGAGKPYAAIGNAVGAFAKKGGYTLITNLASHGVGRSLHEEPTEIATWPDASERRRMVEGAVFTIEPFLSLGRARGAGRTGQVDAPQPPARADSSVRTYRGRDPKRSLGPDSAGRRVVSHKP